MSAERLKLTPEEVEEEVLALIEAAREQGKIVERCAAEFQRSVRTSDIMSVRAAEELRESARLLSEKEAVWSSAAARASDEIRQAADRAARSAVASLANEALGRISALAEASLKRVGEAQRKVEQAEKRSAQGRRWLAVGVASAIALPALSWAWTSGMMKWREHQIDELTARIKESTKSLEQAARLGGNLHWSDCGGTPCIETADGQDFYDAARRRFIIPKGYRKGDSVE